MFHIDREYETPIASNYYQNDSISSNPKEPDNHQDKVNFTPHSNETNPNLNNIYQRNNKI